MMFGTIAAVLRYNLCPHMLSELACKILGLPIVCYFGDFGALTPASLGAHALDVFARFCAISGIRPKVEKYCVGARITCLGLGVFPRDRST